MVLACLSRAGFITELMINFIESDEMLNRSYLCLSVVMMERVICDVPSYPWLRYPYRISIRIYCVLRFWELRYCHSLSCTWLPCTVLIPRPMDTAGLWFPLPSSYYINTTPYFISVLIWYTNLWNWFVFALYYTNLRILVADHKLFWR